MKVNYKKIAVAFTLTAVSSLVLAGLVQAAAFASTNHENILGNAVMINRALENLIDNKPVEFIKSIAFSVQASLGTSRLKIPTINVDALIESMGVTQDGAMEAPSGAEGVGWYAFGPRPGDNGSAVIDGHYGHWKNGDVSVFDDLNKLIPGDKIYVEDENGAAATFVVRELRTYDPSADASDVFNLNDGKSHLNIITCAGDWLVDQNTYSNRLVVFADKEIK